jgi:hypothetical protein
MEMKTEMRTTFLSSFQSDVAESMVPLTTRLLEKSLQSIQCLCMFIGIPFRRFLDLFVCSCTLPSYTDAIPRMERDQPISSEVASNLGTVRLHHDHLFL